MSLVAATDDGVAVDDAVDDVLGGHLCRCTGYVNIRAADPSTPGRQLETAGPTHGGPAVTWVGQRLPRFEDPRLLTGRGRFTDDIELPGLLHAAIVAVPGRPRHPPRPRHLRARRAGRARCSVRPSSWRWPRAACPWSGTCRASSSTTGPSSATGCASSASRSASWWPTTATGPRTPSTASWSRSTSCPRWSTPGPRSSRAHRSSTTAGDDNVMCRFDVGDTAEHTDAVFAGRGRDAVVPPRHRPGDGHPDGAEGHRRRPRRRRPPHGVDLEPGPPRRARRHRRDHRPPPAPHPGGRPRRRRRLRPEGPPLRGRDHGLPRRPPPGSPGEVDRGPLRVPRRHPPGPGRDRRRRRRPSTRRPAAGPAGSRPCATPGATSRTSAAVPCSPWPGCCPGPYTWDAVRTEATVVATNTTPTGAYRGFGQTQAVFVVRAGGRPGRRRTSASTRSRSVGRNMIRPEQQPYATRCVPITYDNGDYAAALDRAARSPPPGPSPPTTAAAGASATPATCTWPAWGPARATPTSGLDVGSWESAIARMEPDGTVRLFVGTSPQGQGHDTTFVQLAADRLGIEPGDIELVHSDTDRSPYSAYGTAASRSIAVGGGAVVEASDGPRRPDPRASPPSCSRPPPPTSCSPSGRATVAGTNVSVTDRRRRPTGLAGLGAPRGRGDARARVPLRLRPRSSTRSPTAPTCAGPPSTPTPASSRSSTTAWCSTAAPW